MSKHMKTGLNDAPKKVSEMAVPGSVSISVTITRDSRTGRFVNKDRVASAVKDAKERYGETLRRLK